MSTNTITLPKTEYLRLQEMAQRFELIKSVIEPDVFSQPATINTKTILKEFKKAGLYNDKFLKSLARGLKESAYFETSNSN
jgi:hypothetical protein